MKIRRANFSALSVLQNANIGDHCRYLQVVHISRGDSNNGGQNFDKQCNVLKQQLESRKPDHKNEDYAQYAWLRNDCPFH
jgi:hypothetical protein